MRPAWVDPLAAADVARVEAWYQAQRAGLGADFVLQVRNAIARAASAPFAYSTFRRHTRRVLVRRFPYSVYYVVEGDVLRVLAVLHQRRGSTSWQGRIQESAIAA